MAEGDIRKKVVGILRVWERMPVREMEEILRLGKAAVPALIDAVDIEGEPDDEKNYLWPIALLGELRSPEAIPPLISWIRMKDVHEWSLAASEALAKIGPAALPSLTHVVDEGGTMERFFAYVGIGNMPGERCYEILCRALQRDRELADVTANLITDLGRKEAIPLLYQAFTQCEPWQRMEIEDAIKDLHYGNTRERDFLRDWRIRYRPLPIAGGGFAIDWVGLSSITHSSPEIRDKKKVIPLRSLEEILHDPNPYEDEKTCPDCGEPITRPTGLPVCPEMALDIVTIQVLWMKKCEDEGFRDIFEILDHLDKEDRKLLAGKNLNGRIKKIISGKDYDFDEIDEHGVQRETLFWLMENGLRGVQESQRLLEKKKAEMAATFNRESAPPSQKVGRNAPCPCGSGKKYKKCCLPKEKSGRKPSTPEIADQWAYRIGAMERSLAKVDTSKLTPGKGYSGPISDLMTLEIPHAQELVYDAWELLGRGDMKGAKKVFREALKADADLADAHNGLAGVAWERGDLIEAEKEYRSAYEKARVSLISEEPAAFAWWGELETRPYMRARHGLGLVYWKQGRYDEALREFTALLRLNPHDNQGARYLIAPLYQFKGDLDGALSAYESYAQGYPDEIPDPHYYASWGLALCDTGRLTEAVQKWHRMVFSNIYIAPVILGHDPPEADIWHGSNLAMKDYAIEYIGEFGVLWEKKGDALKLLERLWKDPEVQARVERFVEIGKKLKGFEPGKERTRLVDAWRRIEEATMSRECMERIIGEAGN